MFIVFEHTSNAPKRGLSVPNYEITIIESIYGILPEDDLDQEAVEEPEYSDSECSDDEEDEEVPLHTAQTFYDTYVARTREQVLSEEEAPQRSKRWLDARKYSLTASAFGAAVGSNPYMTSDELLHEKLWSTFKGNAATQYGSEHEVDAQASFEQFVHEFEPNARLESRNLMKSEVCPWLAVSPDNLLHREDGSIDLVEYKCPAYLRDTEHHPYRKYPHNVPPYYMDQMQGIMGYLNTYLNYDIQQAWFVVWQDKRTFVIKIPYNDDYFHETLFPQLKLWYFQKYLPALIHKHNGDIQQGETKPVPILDLSAL